MTEQLCPGCGGDRVIDSPDRLADYVHRPGCDVASAEAETLEADRRRYARRLRPVRHRPATDAERLLLAASGIRLEPRTACFTRVEFDPASPDGPPHRRRTWALAPGLVSETGERAEVTTW